jgi:hypothetical protein
MPNDRNISSPINLHGIGRSGTTLLQNVLGTTGLVQVCNEIGALVFCCYRGVEVALGSDDREPTISDTATPGSVARAALRTMMPSSKPYWCQKLGGLPTYICWDMIEECDREYALEPYSFPYRWFWKVLRTSFPDSKDVLILRDYRDIIISRHLFSGWGLDNIACDLAVYFNLMAHHAAKVDYVLRYEDLVTMPQDTVRRLFDFLALPGEVTAVQALHWHASASNGEDLSAARERGFSWRSKHAALISDRIMSTVVPALRRLEQKFGLELSSGS